MSARAVRETSRGRHASATSLVSNAATSHIGRRAVIEEQLDPRPQPDQFARIIAARAIAAGPVLVLVGPGQRRELEHAPGLETLTLAEGPRRNALLRVKRASSGF